MPAHADFQLSVFTLLANKKSRMRCGDSTVFISLDNSSCMHWLQLKTSSRPRPIPVNPTTMIAFLIGETYNIRIGDNWRPKTTYQSLTLSILGGGRSPTPSPLPWIRHFHTCTIKNTSDPSRHLQRRRPTGVGATGNGDNHFRDFYAASNTQHASIMWPIATDDSVDWCVSQSVTPLTRLRCAKAAEQIEVLFRLETGEQSDILLDGGRSIDPLRRGKLFDAGPLPNYFGLLLKFSSHMGLEVHSAARLLVVSA